MTLLKLLSFGSVGWNEADSDQVDSPGSVEFRKIHFPLRCLVLRDSDVGDLFERRHAIRGNEQCQGQGAHRFR